MPPFNRSVLQGGDNLAGELAKALNISLRQQIENRVRQEQLAQLDQERQFQVQQNEDNQRFQENLADLAANQRQDEAEKNRRHQTALNDADLASAEKIANAKLSADRGAARRQQIDRATQFYEQQRGSIQRELQTLLSSNNPEFVDQDRVAELRRQLDIVNNTQARFIDSKDSTFLPLDFSLPEQPSLEQLFQQQVDASQIGDASQVPLEVLQNLSPGEQGPGILDRVGTGVSGLFQIDPEKSANAAARRKELFNSFGFGKDGEVEEKRRVEQNQQKIKDFFKQVFSDTPI